eukprot:m.211592 g.211592  ORF g.211592 m.211592 type:complete len:76 (+) comp16942_c0_seq52:2017-2244(+)
MNNADDAIIPIGFDNLLSMLEKVTGFYRCDPCCFCSSCHQAKKACPTADIHNMCISADKSSTFLVLYSIPTQSSL